MLLGLTWLDLVNALTVGALAGLAGAILMTWIIAKFCKDLMGDSYERHVKESKQIIAWYVVAAIMFSMLWGNLHGYY